MNGSFLFVQVAENRAVRYAAESRDDPWLVTASLGVFGSDAFGGYVLHMDSLKASECREHGYNNGSLDSRGCSR